MPRKRVFNKTSNWNMVVKSKFRIGNRKGGVPANSLTTKTLLLLVADTNKTKYHKNAYAVLRNRKNIAQSV